MSDYSTNVTSEEIQNQVGPEMVGTGSFKIINRGRVVNLCYQPKGEVQVLYGLNDERPSRELPHGIWVSFQDMDKIVFVYSTAQELESDFVLDWNLLN